MKAINLEAPAKINLNLKIGPKTTNGLHQIESLAVKLPLADELTVAIKPQAVSKTKIQLLTTGDFKAKVPTNADNLAFKAAKAYLESQKIKTNLQIQLIKNIPHKAGLGGASSDAAAVIVALEKLFYPLATLTKANLALSLGSDVNFFLSPEKAAIIGSTGEQIQPEKAAKGVALILLPAIIRVNTTWGYSVYDQYLGQFQASSTITNDFEPVIFQHFPDLQALKEVCLDQKATQAGLSGSGSAIFALFKSNDQATKARKKIENEFKLDFVYQGDL
jgi:4-diphosphocytidyl-2-C-methyl-D-erythritol kinase